MKCRVKYELFKPVSYVTGVTLWISKSERQQLLNLKVLKEVKAITPDGIEILIKESEEEDDEMSIL